MKMFFAAFSSACFGIVARSASDSAYLGFCVLLGVFSAFAALDNIIHEK